MLVPVVDRDGVPLMPTTKHRAMKLVARKEATPFWNKGVWCIRLNREPSGRAMQDMALGIDPGSKREALVVKTEAHTVINVQLDAITYVSDRVSTRRSMRRGRRNRKTPNRSPKKNNVRNRAGWIPPSTKARWQWKLRIVDWLRKLYPITDIVVEDVKARSKSGSKHWNLNFSPMILGKTWFYEELSKRGRLTLKSGIWTYETRKWLGLNKSSNKMAMRWDAHCVDAWCLAYGVVGGVGWTDDKSLLHLTQIPLSRRQLHVMNYVKGVYVRTTVAHDQWGLNAEV